MRQRTTFFHKNENGIEPTSLKVSGRSISGPDILAVREDRITLGLEELPTELQELLRRSHELHIRWVSPFPHESIGPWNSRLPPGLHAFYTPEQSEKTDLGSELLCPLIRTTFGVSGCSTLQESFTRLPNDRFSHSTAYQYYHPLSSLAHFVLYASQYVCLPSSSSSSDCKQQVKRLSSAASLDFSYDAISHTAKVTAQWPHERQPLSLANPHPDHHRVEVGLLTPDESPLVEPHELGATGLLTVLGEDSRPAPVLFSFPSRHMRARGGSSSRFSAEFLSPAGLHPTLRLRVSGPSMLEEGEGEGEEGGEGNGCSLHAYLTLPRAVFADRYQLADELFLASKNLTALRWASSPVDLEAPDYVMKVWGSSVLLELRPPSPPSSSEEKQGEPTSWTAEIPLHLRYLAPAPGGYRTVEVPYPAVFWACPAEEGTKFPNSPFERANLGYDGLFGPRTMFWHVSPEPERGDRVLMNSVEVPVLDLDRAGWVRSGTAAVVLLGFAWVVWKLAGVYVRTGYGSNSKDYKREARKEKEKGKDEKKVQ